MEEGARSRERPQPSEEDEDLRRPAMHGASNFIWWTWQMLESGSEYIRWSEDGTCIVVTNPERMATSVLPRFFRRSQYSSWVRALNAYSFRKVGVGRWRHPDFQRGVPERLQFITRQTPGQGKAAGSHVGTSTALVSHANTLAATVAQEKRMCVGHRCPPDKPPSRPPARPPTRACALRLTPPHPKVPAPGTAVWWRCARRWRG